MDANSDTPFRRFVMIANKARAEREMAAYDALHPDLRAIMRETGKLPRAVEIDGRVVYPLQL